MDEPLATKRVRIPGVENVVSYPSSPLQEMEDGRHFHICVDCMLPLDNFQLNLPPTVALDREDCLPDFKLPSVGRLPPMACQREDTWAQFGKL